MHFQLLITGEAYLLLRYLTDISGFTGQARRGSSLLFRGDLARIDACRDTHRSHHCTSQSFICRQGPHSREPACVNIHISTLLTKDCQITLI